MKYNESYRIMKMCACCMHPLEMERVSRKFFRESSLETNPLNPFILRYFALLCFPYSLGVRKS